MKISVIIAHPSNASFNHAIAEKTIGTLKANGHEVIYHDLYKEGFDPLLIDEEIARDIQLPTNIEKHCYEATQADGFVIIHPNWWGMPPAILTGWVDRIMRPGVAYEFLENDSGEGVPNGLLQADKVVVFNTSNTEADREINVFLDPLETIWKNCVFDLCGVSTFHRKMFNIMVTSSEEERRDWLNEVEETISSVFE